MAHEVEVLVHLRQPMFHPSGPGHVFTSLSFSVPSRALPAPRLSCHWGYTGPVTQQSQTEPLACCLAHGKCSVNISFYYSLKVTLKPHFKLHATKSYYPQRPLLPKYTNTQGWQSHRTMLSARQSFNWANTYLGPICVLWQNFHRFKKGRAHFSALKHCTVSRGLDSAVDSQSGLQWVRQHITPETFYHQLCSNSKAGQIWSLKPIPTDHKLPNQLKMDTINK